MPPHDPAALLTVYVSIGNSDDKLTQREWARFVQDTGYAVHRQAREVHGVWLSPPDWEYQNACFCLEIPRDEVRFLKAELAGLCETYRQDSIAWAEAPATEFIHAGQAP
ncbi:hypothetical protein ABZ470_39375 [Streptosporangium sp. NPDC020072]|uniref:hypothetical protein n=1 Tax=Streptosporangium sp. NPDC020072 TaxID=3154788 RepID=UPI00342E303D